MRQADVTRKTRQQKIARPTSAQSRLLPIGYYGESCRNFYTRSTARTSFTLVILILAGGVVLLLGTVGLYGVISYSVSRRTREIGVRIALGARPETVLRLIMARAMTTIAAGLMLGIASALVLTRLLASMLFGVSPADPSTYMVVVLLLGVVMVAASFAPAARAARLDPVVALRQE